MRLLRASHIGIFRRSFRVTGAAMRANDRRNLLDVGRSRDGVRKPDRLLVS
jgi:hypothetical protein